MDPQQIMQFPHAAAPAALPTLSQRELDTHQLFFAMGEAMAHLHYLYYRGLLKRQVGADGVVRYQQDAAFSEGAAA